MTASAGGRAPSPLPTADLAAAHPGSTDIEFRGELIYFIVVDRFFQGIRRQGREPVHGYWTRDFKRVSPHWMASPDVFSRSDTTLDRLIAALKERGMKFVLDIVCNHSSRT